jgi:hypothetical protein
MECNTNQKENENEENSSSTNNSINKINIYNRIINIESPIFNINLRSHSQELKIITNICNLFTEICDNNSKECISEKNLIKPFITINPSIKIKDYLQQLYEYGKMDGSTIILMLIYIDRLCNINKIKLTYRIIHKLILSSLIIAIKYNEDEIYSLKIYARAGGVTKAELEFLEICFISCIHFNLFIKEELFNKYYDYFADEDSEEDDEDEEEKKEIGVRTEKNREENKDNEKREQNVNSKKIKYKGDQKQNG